MSYFMDEMDYCSDSTGRWRYGSPRERFGPESRQPIHLLTHPVWWGVEDLPPEERLGHLLRGRSLSSIDWISNELSVVPSIRSI